MVKRSDSPEDGTDNELDANVDSELAADLRLIAESRLALSTLRGLHEVRLSADENTIELTLEEVTEIANAIDDPSFPESQSECLKRLNTELLPVMDQCGIIDYDRPFCILANVITSLVWLVLDPQVVAPEARDTDEVAANAAWVLMWFNDVDGAHDRCRHPQ